MTDRSSPAAVAPPDPVADAMVEVLCDLLSGVSVKLAYTPAGEPAPVCPASAATMAATGAGPKGWQLTVIVRLHERIASLVTAGSRSLSEILGAMPGAGLRAAEAFRPMLGGREEARLSAPLRRALRDAVAALVLEQYLASRIEGPVAPELVAETLEFLVELSSSRVESHDLTHGVVITDVLADVPRLKLAYPADVQAAKRAPLLFDGQRSLLIVDPAGRARTELQRHRFERLGVGPTPPRVRADDIVESGALVAEATALLGGMGFFLRADKSIWTFVDGQPLLVRRGERWRAFPFELAASIRSMIGPGSAAGILAKASFLISAQPQGAILAIIDDASLLDGIVPAKDRYDLRDDIDPMAMRTETRLHHLIDGDDLDEHTVARLAALDGATILDRNGRLLAYGAIVNSSDSQHEGARTAAARTLSETALVVLKVSVDGDITIFRSGRPVTTLLGPA